MFSAWQLCSGVDENSVGACAQLVFAPIDESFADDAPLLPSGFRVIPLDPKTVRTLQNIASYNDEFLHELFKIFSALFVKKLFVELKRSVFKLME